MKIVIARPVLSAVEAESEKSLMEMLAVTTGHQLFYIPCIGNSIIHEARNFLVRKAYDIDFDVILFIDADMEFPASTINELVKHNKSIVGVRYSSRVEEGTLNAFTYRPEKNTYVRMVIPRDSGLVEVDAIGTGVMLIKREVFDAIRDPWFFYDTHFSEDVNFCHMARQIGYKIYCDTKLDVAHIGKHKYRMA